MLAQIRVAGDGYEARFERALNHPVEEAWAYLTDNEKLPKWFAELRVEELREGGHLSFAMGGDEFERMKILDLSPPTVLGYEWGEDAVRFELSAIPEGCRLTLIEKIGRITEHTPRDLAGWHVCLDVIGMLMDGEAVGDRKAKWEGLYPQYVRLVEGMKAN